VTTLPRFINTPSHGYLIVSKYDVIGSGYKPSRFSYEDPATGRWYLEEDCDAPGFLRAAGLPSNDIPDDYTEADITCGLTPLSGAGFVSPFADMTNGRPETQPQTTLDAIVAEHPNRAEWPAFAWPGGYPVGYLAADGESICAPCVNDPTNPIEHHTDDPTTQDWHIIAAWILEDQEEDICAHCGRPIATAAMNADAEGDHA
jgi:hypothetical protein